MHRAWLIEDIWRLLLPYFTPGHLAVLARTCRSLSDLVTHELWHAMRSIEPFLSCLPRDYRTRSLHSRDLVRLDFYSAKIETITFEGSSRYPLELPFPFRSNRDAPDQMRSSPYNKKNKIKNAFMKYGPQRKTWEELWGEIAALRQNSEFLPNLRRLRFNIVDERYLLPLIGTTTGKLEYIYMRGMTHRQDPSLVTRFLDSIQDVSNLKYLCVRDGQNLIPSKTIIQAPLKHVRLDPHKSPSTSDGTDFKEVPLRPDVLHKDSLEHLTLGLSRIWHSPALRLKDRKYLPQLKTLWLNLTTVVDTSPDSWVHSPAEFLEALDKPKLDLLNIKFRYDAKGPILLSIVDAANRYCRLRDLEELALGSDGWHEHYIEWFSRPAPLIKPVELRQALQMLLPLPRLKFLRINVAPNFLDILDLTLYQQITMQLPALEKLCLGHDEFVSITWYEISTLYERVSLHHLAAFCHLFPNLREVSVGWVDPELLEESIRPQWSCPQVKLVRWCWPGSEDTYSDRLRECIQCYFPKSNMARKWCQ